MKRLVCELCGGNSLLKKNGVYICQECGTQYSLEDARALVQELLDNEEKTVEQPNDTSELEGNYYYLARIALDAQNYSDAEHYCDKALELNPKQSSIWNLKGQVIAQSSTIKNNRIIEASRLLKQSLLLTAEEDKNREADFSLNEIETAGLKITREVANAFVLNPNVDNYKAYLYFTRDLCTALEEVLSDYCSDAHLSYDIKISSIMTKAADQALKNVNAKWSDRPRFNIPKEQCKDYICSLEAIEMLYRSLIQTSTNDYAGNIHRFQQLSYNLLDQQGATNSTIGYENTEFGSRPIEIVTHLLPESKLQALAVEIKDIHQKVEELKKQLIEYNENERLSKIKAYWDTHLEEKRQLLLERDEKQCAYNSLSKQCEDLQKEYDSFSNRMTAISREYEEKIDNEKNRQSPIEEKMQSQIILLESKKEDRILKLSKLGIFSGKEKRTLSSEIDSIDSELMQLRDSITQEHENAVKQAENRIKPIINEKEMAIKPLEKEMQPIKEKIDNLKERILPLDKRLKEIDSLLNSVPNKL